jgi:poly-gamma-glutamate capsule biosynthesis protein CapA/YwtB (metallophosphatase superfamily)
VIDFSEGRAVHLQALPLRMRRFRLERVGDRDADWLKGRLTDAAKAPELHLTQAGLLAGSVW